MDVRVALKVECAYIAGSMQGLESSGEQAYALHVQSRLTMYQDANSVIIYIAVL